jgi:hypothetical protein
MNSRSAMPKSQYTENPEMANAISSNQVFSAIASEVEHERTVQAMRYNYTYSLSGSIVGQQTLPFEIVIEQGSDFSCQMMTGSAFSYDTGNATSFPIPNSLGATAWAGRGLSVNIVETRSGRTLTSGFVAWELLFAPGYAQGFQRPYPFRYHFYRNSKIRFDIRNRDNANRTHTFDVALNGYKIITPE